MIPEVVLEMEKQSLLISDFLLQNSEPIHEGRSPPLILFRWRFRVCSSCSRSFDIEREGRFYTCGDCV